MDYLNQSLQLRKELNDLVGEGTILNNIATILLEKEKYDEALTHFEQSLAIVQKTGNSKKEALTLNNIGLVYKNQKKYQKALQYLEQSKAIQTEIGDTYGLSLSLNNIAVILYEWKKQREKAIPLFLEALQNFEAMKSPNSKIPAAYLRQIESELGEKRYRKLVNRFLKGK